MPDCRRPPSSVSLVALAFALVLAGGVACQSPAVSGGGSPAGAARDGGGGDFRFVVPDVVPGGAPAGPGPGLPPLPGDEGAACAAEVHKAQPIPLDLLLLVDTSASMSQPVDRGGNPGAVGLRTKWDLVLDALVGFIKDPRSAGLGIGLHYFPLGSDTPMRACASDADCSPAPAGVTLSCDVTQRECVSQFIPPGSGRLCARAPGLPEQCPAGTTCVTPGRCSASGAPCYPLGGPCPGTAGVCQPSSGVCISRGGSSCAVSDYARLAVPVGQLPAAEATLLQNLTGRQPTAGTPTGPALAGALESARARQAANPGHRVALVLATDGMPSECQPSDGAGLAALAAAARTATPAITTYVIGVFSSTDAATARPLLQQIATGGGTGMPFVLDTTADLGQRFREALDEIRGAALPCEFTIPRSNAGPLDFGKVNVRFQSAGGQAENLPYVRSADRCDPMRGGWYYDVDPAAGGTPTRVVACPLSCARFKTDRAAQVGLVFGCKTTVIE